MTEAPELSILEAIPAYSEETATRLFRRLRGPIEGVRNYDRGALRDYLVLSHAPLVEHCARGFVRHGEPMEDLVQEGYVGLIKAVDRFDPESGVQFSTYACHLIQGEMRHYLRDLGKLIHEPGWHSELRGRVLRTGDQLAQRLGRAATPDEIAGALELSVATINDVTQKAALLSVESLDAPQESEDGQERSRVDRVSDDAPDEASLVDNAMLLDRALPRLRPLEKRAVQAFFWEEKSKTEIARELGISINYAAYLVKRGLEALREASGEGDAPSAADARSAYLLASARDAGGPNADPNARRKTPKTSPILAMRARVEEFSDWSRSLDDEVARATRYGEEFGVLWLRIANWDQLSGRDDNEARRALESLKALLRRACRGVDKVGVMPPHALPGLHLLSLMPHCGLRGDKLGERWEMICAEALSEGKRVPQVRWAFGLFPQQGRGAEELLGGLSAQVFAD